MPTQIEVLATLQLVDQSLHTKTRAVAEGEGRVAALEEAVRAQTAAASAARDELAALGVRQRDLEGRLAVAEAKMKDRRMRITRIRNDKEPISLETPVGEEEDSVVGDFIEDMTALSPADAVMAVHLQDQTRKVLATLTPREEQVLRLRFGIGERTDHTLEEVGTRFAVTRERIRQIEAKALRKLRHPSRARRLRGFAES